MEKDIKDIIETGRKFLKPAWNTLGKIRTDQAQGISVPEIQKPYNTDNKLLDLMPIDKITCGKASIIDVFSKRRSIRKYKNEAIGFEELSYLLWATQGVRENHKNYSLRTVPSAGARHCFETYLFISRVEGLEQGLYRYLPLDNKLGLVSSEPDLEVKLNYAMLNQNFDSAVTFIWTAIPYRMEWRYSIVSHKMIAIDVGHVCQNLYLASESIGCGCCAIGAYAQDKMDVILKVDGEEEFSIYMATVGKHD
jgi:SagB-type dehydrogenase family enzyme